jgi:hypothetical protein
MYTSVDFISKIARQRRSHTPIWCLVTLKKIIIIILYTPLNVVSL